MNTFTLNTVELSFKEFLEKIHQESNLTKEEFYKHKIVLIISDMEIYNLVKNSPLIYYSNPMEIKTKEDLQKSNAMLPILNPNLFYITRKNADFTYILAKRTEQELNEQIYKETLEKIDENLVNIDAELNEFYSKTNITQYYLNNYNNPVELILKLPYNPSIQFSKFTLDINGKKVISKILDKDKAKEKYNDAISSGKTGAISSKEDNYIIVNIGNIEPKSLVKLTTEFIQFLTSEDMSFCYSTITDFPIIDIKNNKENNNEKLRNIKAKINIKAHSKILRLITEGLSKNISQKFNKDYTKCLIEYSLSEKDRQNQFNQKIIKEKRKKDSDSDDSEEEEKIEVKNINKNNFKILFRTERMNDYNLITQYDPKKDETSCILSMIYNRNDINIPKGDLPDLDNEKKYIEIYQKNLINSYPSLFIFLIDQSGSMSGKPINIVKESLLFFLQSLPKNSYYQLIGFGSSMKYISSEEPLEYTVENVKKTIEKVKKLKANLGGTELYKPLQNIFSNENSDNLNLCKNLFILTDGEVWDREKSLKIIKNNLDVFRVHSFGIGNSFDEKFIVESGKNGSYNFIKDIDKIKSSVIQTLNKALRNYLYDFKIDVKNIDTEYNYFPKQKIYYQDELLNYYFIIKHKLNNNININIEYYDKKELIKKVINFDNNNNNIISENDGDIISKIIIGNILNNTDLPQDKNIELSKRYQVLSKYTSLYAEVENEKSTQNEMLKIEQKKLEEIEESESDSDNDIKKPKPKKRRRKCNWKKKVESDSDSESDSGKKYKKRKCMKKCKKISNDSESDEKEEKNCKKKKCRKISNDSESDEGQVKECKNVSNDSESDEKEKKKCKKRSKKCRNISNESDEKEVKKFIKNKCKKKLSDSESEEEDENDKHSNKKTKKVFDVKEMTLTQNIIDGNWSINSQTQFLIDSYDDIYNKIKKYVEKLDVRENKEDIIVTILVLYYLKNNKDIDQTEYLLIINKGLQYLKNLGIKEFLYENIESNIK